MDSSPLMPASNTTPVRCCSDYDATCKRKSVCMPTRPTPPSNERVTPLNPPHSGPRSFVLPPNPYWSSQPNVRIADTYRASTPQLQRLRATSVTPGSSAKKKRATTVHSTSKSQSNKSGNKFKLSTSELYKPFRESILLRIEDPGVVPGAVSHADAALDADSDVVVETPTDARADADEDMDANADTDAAANAAATTDVDADIIAQLHANTGDTRPVPSPDLDYNDFDTKANSLMRNHFIHTRTSTKQKQSTSEGRVLRLVVTQNNFNDDCDEEALDVTTTDTRRLSHLMLEDFIVLPATTPLLLMIPTAGSSPWTALGKSTLECQPTATV
eukprot:scaffold4342_cov34-Attheya_sp.AAC.2